MSGNLHMIVSLKGASAFKKNDSRAEVQMALKVEENAKDIWEQIRGAIEKKDLASYLGRLLKY